MRNTLPTFKSALILALLAVAAPATAFATEAAPEQSEALKAKESYARHFAQMVLAIVQDTKKSFTDRKTILREAFSKSVDIDWIAKFVLGSGWARATDDQKTKYTALYRKFLTETYVANFAENPDKRIRDIKIFGVNENNASDFTVRTSMMLADMQNLNVSYLVNDTEGHYRVRDIAIENVSLITTHRSEFSALANSKGIDGVITELQTRLNSLENKEKEFSENNAPQPR